MERTMPKVTAFEARTRFGELLERVSRGEEVRRAVSGLLELQDRIRRRSRAKLTDREVRAAIEEGRA
jgi:antitoxin (DNA-binding transcriptional repressor) of toxin-antitoxin stability system